MSGCSAIGAYIGKLKGELFGNDYIIRQYDDFGNLVFTIHGDRVTMDCELDENGEVSSYIDITIDGKADGIYAQGLTLDDGQCFRGAARMPRSRQTGKRPYELVSREHFAAKIRAAMVQVQSAFHQQLDALNEFRFINLESEMDVLRDMLKADGLIDEEKDDDPFAQTLGRH